jgi:hypothetical protein
MKTVMGGGIPGRVYRMLKLHGWLLSLMNGGLQGHLKVMHSYAGADTLVAQMIRQDLAASSALG